MSTKNSNSIRLRRRLILLEFQMAPHMDLSAEVVLTARNLDVEYEPNVKICVTKSV